MKSYSLVVAATLLSLILGWVALFYFALGNPFTRATWTSDIYELKQAAVDSIEGEKIVIVAGSNVVFGLNTPQLRDDWQVPVVNFGSHAGLGLEYLLERSKRGLKPGDIAILPLEYELYQETGTFSETLIIHALSADPEYFHTLDLKDKLTIMMSLKFKNLRRASRAAFWKLVGSDDAKNGRSKGVGIYTVENMNAFGDQIHLEPDNISAADRKAITKLANSGMVAPVITDFAKTTLQHYIRWARRHNICLIFTPPHLLQSELNQSDAVQRFFSAIKSFLASQNAIHQGNAYNFMLDPKYYFEHVYHLDSLGVDLATTQLLAVLKPTPRALCKVAKD